jgi:hypothetical protein
MSLGNAIGVPFGQTIDDSIYNIMPGEIHLHIDASDTSTLWKDQAGAVPLKNHNEYARRVDNKAFLYQEAYGMTTTTPLGKFYISLTDDNGGSPQWVQNASGANGYSALYFGGAAQGLYCSMASLAEGAVYDPTGFFSGFSASSTSSGYWQTWIVVKGTGTVSSEETVYCNTGNVNIGCGYADMEWSINLNGTDSQWEMNIGGNVKDSTVASNSNFELWTFKNPGGSGSNCFIYRNGDPSDGASPTATNGELIYNRVIGSNQDCAALSIGCHTNNAASTFSKNWNGYLFEMVVAYMNGTSGAAMITNMDNYLMNKYNIS